MANLIDLNLPPKQPEAVFSSVVTKDGFLTLPKECLTGVNSGSLIITNSWEEGILCLYTPESFAVVRHGLESLNMIDPKARLLRRLIIASAEKIEVDTEGRIQIDPEFFKNLGFDPEHDTSFSVVILKLENRIEIVSGASYETTQ